MWRRYEKYMSATTLGEYRADADDGDLAWDYWRGYLTRLVYVDTHEMRADVMTKVPSSGQNHELQRARLMGHGDQYSK